jgi:uncharacterized protein (TIGR04255 family)
MPAVSRPLAGRNAIEAMAFVVSFAREFDAEQIECLYDLETVLQSELPRFTRIETTILSIEQSMPPRGQAMPVTSQQARPAGVALQRFSTQGKADWSLRVEGNRVVATCRDYTRWHEVAPVARRFVSLALERLRSETNGVTNIALQTVDRFTYENFDDYSVHEVFREDCPYLTRNVASAGNLWHVHQGWFEAITLPGVECRALHVLNLASIVNQAGGYSTHIDHTGRVDFIGAGPLMVDDVLRLEASAFQAVHDVNRTIIRGSLQDEKLRSIGLLQ